ncbi:aminotransferase class V-fold PLP-dependent enzyme [Filobacillus milosensis]|uniref:Aminotransferase class V-fold PLP-dependent enzyme n=2 Tax=Filobacillus milosensis TaxID=94137 RepID=A0A4Y8IQD9_9BACI|nr:aminotransferase class V-fold PLP-dependent enzyme [Filobacillus milosensis]
MTYIFTYNLMNDKRRKKFSVRGMNVMIYFDYAATTPMSNEALKAYIEVAQKYYGNTNSLHDLGAQSEQLLEQCKGTLANLIGGEREGIYFTNGGSESNMLGIKLLLNQDNRKHIIISTAEHNSNHQITRFLELEGYKVSHIPFTRNGQIDIDFLKYEITNDTALVIVQHINGEIGTIQPINEVAEICKRHDIFLHVDCVQSFGKIDLKNISPVVDSLSVSSHKIYGPKGIGFLYTNHQPTTSLEQLILHGNTYDLPGIVSFTVAANEAIELMESEKKQLIELREAFIEQLEPIKEFITIYENKNQKQLPSIIGMAIEGIEGQWVMLECNRQGYAISTGSACDVKYNQTPNTLRALQEDEIKAKGFFRISFGRQTNMNQVKELGRFLVAMTLQYKGTVELNP